MDNFEKLFNKKRKEPVGRVVYLNDELLEATEYYKFMMNGILLYKQGKYPLALRQLNKAIKESKTHYHLYQIRASIKEELEDYRGAIADYKQALSFDGTDWYSIYNQVGINYLQLKANKKALLAFEIALELKKEASEGDKVFPKMVAGMVMKANYECLYFNRAIAKLYLQDLGGSLKDCEKAIKIKRSYSSPYFIIGLIFIQVMLPKLALKYFIKAKKYGHQSAEEAIERYFGNNSNLCNNI